MSIKQIKDLKTITIAPADWVMVQKARSLTTGKVSLEKILADGKFVPITGGQIFGNLAVSGNLIVHGATITVDSTTLKVKDKLIEVAKDNNLPLLSPAGLIVRNYDGEHSCALVYDVSGTAYVGDVNFDERGNVDVENSDLAALATQNFVLSEIDKAIVETLNTAV